MWNYRLIKDKELFGLHEVMYNDDGKIFAHTEKPEITGESVEDIISTLNLMLGDAEKYKEDILIKDEIEFASVDWGEEEKIEYKNLEDLL